MGPSSAKAYQTHDDAGESAAHGAAFDGLEEGTEMRQWETQYSLSDIGWSDVQLGGYHTHDDAGKPTAHEAVSGELDAGTEVRHQETEYGALGFDQVQLPRLRPRKNNPHMHLPALGSDMTTLPIEPTPSAYQPRSDDDDDDGDEGDEQSVNTQQPPASTTGPDQTPR
jgi:hypothetical protein